MSCLECGPRIVKNGHESTKMRGKMQRGHRLQKNEVLEESCWNGCKPLPQRIDAKGSKEVRSWVFRTSRLNHFHMEVVPEICEANLWNNPWIGGSASLRRNSAKDAPGSANTSTSGQSSARRLKRLLDGTYRNKGLCMMQNSFSFPRNGDFLSTTYPKPSVRMAFRDIASRYTKCSAMK